MKLFVSVDERTKFLNPQIRAYIEERFDASYRDFSAPYAREDFKKFCCDCDAVLTGWGHPLIDREMLEGTKIKLIAHTGGSVGSLVAPELYDDGIKVISGNLLYAESVAEGVIGYMLTGLRDIPYFVQKVKGGSWLEPGDATEGLLDQTVGIIGFGTIANILIRMLQIFRVKIKIYSAYPIDEKILRENNAVQTSLEEVLSTCRIVSLHSAMNEQNRGLIGKKQFDLLQDGALFLNTARGRVVKEDEMIEALRENRFKAVLDVYYDEPMKEDNPLRKMDNVYCIPHLAGPTYDRRPYITKAVVDNIVKFEKGEALELEITKELAARMTVGG